MAPLIGLYRFLDFRYQAMHSFTFACALTEFIRPL